MADPDVICRNAFELQFKSKPELALQLWDLAATTRPLSHMERTNRLLCLYSLGKGKEIAGEAYSVLQDAAATDYFNHCLVLAVLCAGEAGHMGAASDFVKYLAETVEEGVHERQWNVYDLPGIADWVA